MSDRCRNITTTETMTRRSEGTLSSMSRFHRRGNGTSLLVGGVVVSVHIVAWLLLADPLRDDPKSVGASNATAAMIDYFILEQSDLDVVPMPEAKLVPFKYNQSELTQVRFEDAEQGDIAGVVAAASAPRLTEACARVCDPARFSADLHLAAGQSATVVLVIEVRPDGSTGSSEISKSSGNSAADAAAIQYAQTLHWIPGTRDRRARSMRVRFPVTLVRASS
jgi:TonB family protein